MTNMKRFTKLDSSGHDAVGGARGCPRAARDR
jgi:hypothetical protein